MKREFLESIEINGEKLTKEIVDQIMNENGRDIEKEKGRTTSLQTEIDTVKNQLSEANKQIEGFKNLDIEGIKKAADDYKTKFEAAETENKAAIEKLKLNYAIESALSGAKAKNAKAVMALLDPNGFKLNGNEVVGLNEQLEKIKADNGYLFDGGEEPPIITHPIGGGDNNKGLTGVEAAFLRRNPGLKID